MVFGVTAEWVMLGLFVIGAVYISTTFLINPAAFGVYDRGFNDGLGKGLNYSDSNLTRDYAVMNVSLNYCVGRYNSLLSQSNDLVSFVNANCTCAGVPSSSVGG